MYFKRNIDKHLKQWSKQESKKPLLLMGARQVGKTTTIKTFAQENFEKTAFFNFEKQPEIHELFRQTRDPQRLITNLSLIFGQTITQDTLIVFDEVQECRDALISLKYFHEDAGEYSIIGAGSLLGLTLGQNLSFPVGKVEFLDLHPLTFSEFLEAIDQKLFEAYSHYFEITGIQKIPDIFFNALLDRFRQYMLCGGMPEVCKSVVANKSLEDTFKVQDQILRSYQLDFTKHVSSYIATKIQYIWASIPSQLSKENKKFIYKVVKEGARAREYESALIWLEQAGLLSRIYKVSKPSIPLSAYRDLTSFKIYLFDVGLLIKMSDLDPIKYFDQSKLFAEFKGALVENYVAQSLLASFGQHPNYWESDGIAEINFIIAYQNHIIPIEVKSGATTKSKSMSVFKSKYHPRMRLRLSSKNITLDDDMLNLPIFYADKVSSFIDKVLK